MCPRHQLLSYRAKICTKWLLAQVEIDPWEPSQPPPYGGFRVGMPEPSLLLALVNC